jgi:hypothetical protein
MPIEASYADVREVAGGYIVHLGASDNVHDLNRTAEMLFDLCDGKHEANQVVAIVAGIFGLAPGNEDEIRAGPDALRKAGLVTAPTPIG